MTHTPGPWAVHPLNAIVVPAGHVDRPVGAHEDPQIDLERYAQEICALHWPDRNRGEWEVRANAWLIAAAPDLLEALRACADDLEASVNAEYVGTLDYPSQARKHERDLEPVRKARAAIAKATNG